MRIKESRSFINLRKLLIIGSLFLLWAANIIAQVPAINPEKTVNPATGAMGFSLPLGNIKGVNGYNFPVNLNYHAGIHLTEEASPAGLGFSYEPGGVTRKVVYVPDDNIDNTSYYEDDTEMDCYTSWWVWVKNIGKVALDIISLIVCPPVGVFFAIVGGVGFVLDAKALVMTGYNPAEYLAGGDHDKSYYDQFSDPSHDPNFGKGFFQGGSGNKDLPDQYFINTPYINGRMCPTGNIVNNKLEFKLSVSNGAPGSRAIIFYDKIKEEFEIDMEDGSRIFIGGTPQTVRHNSLSRTRVWTSFYSLNQPCYKEKTIEQRQNVPTEWLLRVVLGPNYWDNGGGNDPLGNPQSARGEWVAFNFSRNPLQARRIPMTVQGGYYSSVISSTGCQGNYPFEDIYLESIQTPLGKAQFGYADGRLDDFWFGLSAYNWSWNEDRNHSTDAGKTWAPAAEQMVANGSPMPVNRKVLNSIDFYNANNLSNSLRHVELQTSYSLRKNSFHSMRKSNAAARRGWDEYIDATKNRFSACLTLDAIKIYDNANSNMTETKFTYGYNPSGMDPTNVTDVPNTPQPMFFILEPRDYYGYYKPWSYRNNFNFWGFLPRTMDIQNGITYSSAWSMTSMLLPSGMRISWQYESNRYDRCNNVAVLANDPDYDLSDAIYCGTPRFKGGPRVKRMIVDACGTSPPTSMSYFYTSDDKFVEDYTNGSGHATVEPCPYLEGQADPRDDKTKGSYYTPASVCYEKVKIVKNYIFPTQSQPDGRAPSGYSEYEFYTPADYPNGGMYGQIDETWRNGLIKSVSQYNSNKKRINKKVNNYKWIPNTTYNPINYTYLTGGTILPISEVDTMQGVASRVDYKYAQDVASGVNDRVYNKHCQIFNYATAAYILYPNLHLNGIPLPGNLPIGRAVGFSATHSFIGDPAYDDMVAVVHKFELPSNDGVDIIVIADYNNPNKPPVTGIIHVADWNISWNFLVDNFNFDIQFDSGTDVYIWYKGQTNCAKIPNIQISGTGQVTNGTVIANIDPASRPTYSPATKIMNVTFTNNAEMHDGMDFKPEQIFINCDYYFTDDRDGKPNQTITTNSDGRSRITEIIPAFTQTAYQDLSNRNILTPICQTTVYGKEKESGTPTVPYAVSAQATTWSNAIGSAAWAPNKTYEWKANFQTNGTPDKVFADFIHTNGATNPNWQYGGAVTKYNANGQPLETEKPISSTKQLHSSTIYGYGKSLPTGSVVNANFKECGVFTCDYDENKLVTPATFLDADGGWEKGCLWDGSTASNKIADDNPHFGQKSLLLQNGNAGIIRVAKVRGNTTYKLSAWIKVINGSPRLYADYYTGPATVSTWPVHWQTGYGLTPSMEPTVYQETSNGSWTYVELIIPINTGDTWYIMARIGGEGTYKAYVDDIRFAPANAQLTTTYYDLTWRQPNLSIDKNNNPGRLSEYDGYGRLSHTYKLNKNLGANETGVKTLIKSDEYNIVGQCLKPYDPSPEDGSPKVPLSTTTLTWKCDHPSGNVIYNVYKGTTPDNLNPVNVTPLTIASCNVTGLILNQTYFWRVDVVENDGTITKGPVWSFTREYVPLKFPEGWLTCAKRLDDGECLFFMDCIQSENGLGVTFKVNWTIYDQNGTTPYWTSCSCADARPPETQLECNGKKYGIDSDPFYVGSDPREGNYTITIKDDYGTEVTKAGGFGIPPVTP